MRQIVVWALAVVTVAAANALRWRPVPGQSWYVLDTWTGKTVHVVSQRPAMLASTAAICLAVLGVFALARWIAQWLQR